MAQGEQAEVGLPTYLARYKRTALLLACVYLLVCSAYVVISDRWVASIAEAPERHVRLQTYKGLVFVALSSALIYVMARKLLGRIAAAQIRLIDQQQSLVEAERRATAGLIAHGIAHDMNNVLTIGIANFDLLRSSVELDAEKSAMFSDIAHSFERLHDLTRRMSRVRLEEDQAPAKQTDLMEVVRREVQLARRHQLADRCEISVAGPDRLECPLQVPLIYDLLQNLLFNALEAVNGEGRVEVRVAAGVREHVVEVHDSGPGVPPEQRSRIFEALYTTKPGGLGLGLMSAKAAAKKHGGANRGHGFAARRRMLPSRAASSRMNSYSSPTLC
jgi:signal transduction histidine kinase